MCCCSTFARVYLQGYSVKPSKQDQLKSDLRVLVGVEEGAGIVSGFRAIGLLEVFVLCVVAFRVLLHLVGTLIKH